MTFTIKVRTSPGALMTADYECPVHGRFEALVERDRNGDPPAQLDQHALALDLETAAGRWSATCHEVSHWRISSAPVHTQFVVSATQGKSAPKPHPKAMDTRMLAEGRKNEFRRQRKKIREEERHQRVKELLR